MKKEYGCSKYSWVMWVLAIPVFFACWAVLNLGGVNISIWELLAVIMFALVGNAVVSVLGRAGVPTPILRLLVLLGTFIFGAVALSCGVLNSEPVPTHQTGNVPRATSTFRTASTLRPTVAQAYRPVTWMELASFLSDDHTNWSGYDPNYYACIDFSIDLVENAGKQHIKAWIVGVDFYNEEDGHAFVAFETTDRGVVFIEPQKDYRYIDPVVGKPLCDASTGTVCPGTISSIEYVQCDHSHMCTQYFP